MAEADDEASRGLDVLVGLHDTGLALEVSVRSLQSGRKRLLHDCFSRRQCTLGGRRKRYKSDYDEVVLGIILAPDFD